MKRDYKRRIQLTEWGIIALAIVAVSVVIKWIPQSDFHVLFIIALALFGIAIYAKKRYQDVKHWRRCTATILSIREQQQAVAINNTHIDHVSPLIEYRYEFDGVRYQASQIALDKESQRVACVDMWGDEIPAEKRFWYGWQPGMEISVYVNPKHPSDSVVIQSVAENTIARYSLVQTVAWLIVILWMLLFWLMTL